MVPCPLTCVDVAYVCQRCRHLAYLMIGYVAVRQGRSVAQIARFPRSCRALTRVRAGPPPSGARGSPMSADTSDPARYFGREVRRARLAAKMSLAELGGLVGYHASQVSRVERGTRSYTEKFAQRCDRVFPERGGWFHRFYLESRQWSATPPWLRNWIEEHERRAVSLRIWQPSSLSGLLQTEAFALALLRTFPGATIAQVEQRLAARMARQAILTREAPTHLSRGS